jgi:hypothetical protein
MEQPWRAQQGDGPEDQDLLIRALRSYVLSNFLTITAQQILLQFKPFSLFASYQLAMRGASLPGTLAEDFLLQCCPLSIHNTLKYWGFH